MQVDTQSALDIVDLDLPVPDAAAVSAAALDIAGNPTAAEVQQYMQTQIQQQMAALDPPTPLSRERCWD